MRTRFALIFIIAASSVSFGFQLNKRSHLNYALEQIENAKLDLIQADAGAKKEFSEHRELALKLLRQAEQEIQAARFQVR